MPMALTFALRSASACMVPTTAAAPPMSPFMSSMPAAGLIEMPPVSKTTPLPMKQIGLARFDLAPCHCMMATRAGRTLPCATASSAPIFSFGDLLGIEDLDLEARGFQFLDAVGEFDRSQRVGWLVDEVARGDDAVGECRIPRVGAPRLVGIGAVHDELLQAVRLAVTVLVAGLFRQVLAELVVS